jgi:hypothetical protein
LPPQRCISKSGLFARCCKASGPAPLGRGVGCGLSHPTLRPSRRLAVSPAPAILARQALLRRADATRAHRPSPVRLAAAAVHCLAHPRGRAGPCRTAASVSCWTMRTRRMVATVPQNPRCGPATGRAALLLRRPRQDRSSLRDAPVKRVSLAHLPAAMDGGESAALRCAHARAFESARRYRCGRRRNNRPRPCGPRPRQSCAARRAQFPGAASWPAAQHGQPRRARRDARVHALAGEERVAAGHSRCALGLARPGSARCVAHVAVALHADAEKLVEVTAIEAGSVFLTRPRCRRRRRTRKTRLRGCEAPTSGSSAAPSGLRNWRSSRCARWLACGSRAFKGVFRHHRWLCVRRRRAGCEDSAQIRSRFLIVQSSYRALLARRSDALLWPRLL